MKKIMTAVLILALAVTMCLPASATSAAKARDITDEVKVATVIEMYQNKLPIVRADAIFMDANDYTNDTKAADWTAPGTGVRVVHQLFHRATVLVLYVQLETIDTTEAR